MKFGSILYRGSIFVMDWGYRERLEMCHEVSLTMAWEASEDPPMLASIGALR